MILHMNIITMVKEALFPKDWVLSYEGQGFGTGVIRQGNCGFKIFEGTRDECINLRVKAIERAAGQNGALSRKKLQEAYEELLKENPNSNSSEPLRQEKEHS